jgi:microcystin-dependent protein
MAVSLTKRLKLKRWSTSTDEWIGREGFNAQNQTLDDFVAIDAQGPLDQRPAAGVRGFYYFAEDVGQLYRDTGSGWVPIGVDATKLTGKVPTASLPTIPLNLLPTQVPIGGGIVWFGGPLPGSYILPRGQELSRTEYSALFALWGTMHGAGNGSTTFNVPRVSGRTIVASDSSQAEFDTVGETGGVKAVQLTESQMPSHQHGGGTTESGVNAEIATTAATSNPGGTAKILRGEGGGTRTIQSSGHAHGIVTDWRGGSQPHTNLQPYFVGEYLIRAL